MKKNIYFICGNKGGIGKSLLAMTIVHYLHEHGEPVLLLDCDIENQDVYKPYEDIVQCELVDLRDKDGKYTLGNFLRGNSDRIIVVNTPAQIHEFIENNHEVFNMMIDEIKNDTGRDFVMIHMLNTHRETLEFLMDYNDMFPTVKFHVIRNLHFGKAEKFTLYNNESDLIKDIESRGGKTIDFPDLADRVVDSFYSKRMSISSAREQLVFLERFELERWIGKVEEVLQEVIDV